MFKLRCLLSLFIILHLGSFAAFSQPDSAFLHRAVARLENQPAMEKVYLHLNKTDYDFGDTVWYKAYTVVGQHHQLSALSGVLYVELISPKDSLVTRQVLPLVSGVAWSDIPLGKTLLQGSYRVRAYTTWMRNAGPGYFYDQRVMIGGMPPTVSVVKGTKKPDVQFFPEGGGLVSGVRSRVAFKAINSHGTGEDIKGTIEDNEGNVVADFSTQHLGMGVFAFIPQSGKTYRARIAVTGEAGFTIDLPKASDEGYTLSVNNEQQDSILVKIAVSEQTFTHQKSSAFYIIGQNGGKVYYTSQGKLEGLVYTAKVEKSRFPTGIAQFTLFTQTGEPVAGRIVFIRGSDLLNLDISSPNATYTAGQQVKLSLEVTNSNHQPVTGSFSVSVIQESNTATDENAESTILNNLLLTSELKGYIEKPNYYFANNNQTDADLDVLMLTQGYRRYEWKQILADTAKKISYPPESALEIAGTLKTPSGKPIPKGKMTLMAPKENLLRDTIADASGNFKFTNLYLADTITVVLRARKENKGSNVIIGVKQPDYPPIMSIYKGNNHSITISQQGVILRKKYDDYKQAQKLDGIKNGIQLKQVNIHGYKHPQNPDLSYSANLNRGGADQVIMGDDLGDCFALSDCLVTKIFGVSFSQNGVPLNTRGRAPMSVIVDGNILSHDYLNEIRPEEIYSIEVLRSLFAKSIYGSSIESGGALVITLRRGNKHPYTTTPPSGLITYPFIGFYKAKTFYAPKYAAKSNAELPLRNAIYWNPNIITGNDGKASMEYFNAGGNGTYRVVVEGIDDDGNLGRQLYRYKVQ
jgi:hypothetical protein